MVSSCSHVPMILFLRVMEVATCSGPWHFLFLFVYQSLAHAIHSPDNVPTKPMLTTSYVHGTCNLPFTSKTVGQCLEESANLVPDKEAVVFVQDGVRKTFGQLKQEVDQLAAGLLAIGLKKGDRLGMWGPNMYEWVLVQFATAQAGIILVTVNPAYQHRELEFVLKKVGCKALIFPTKFKSQLYYDILKRICPELEQAIPGDLKSKCLPDLRSVIVIGSKPPGSYSFEEVFQAASASHREQLLSLQKKISCDDPINIQFTSVGDFHHSEHTRFPETTTTKTNDTCTDTRICVGLPLYHCFGCVASSLVMTLFNCTVVYSSPSFEARAVLQAIQEERCTVIYGTPMMYIDILSQKDFSTYDLSSLQAGVVGGSFCPGEVLKKAMKQMNIGTIIIGYGMTENSPVTFQGFTLDEITRKTETVGYIGSHIEAKIVDPQTQLIQPLQTSGELLVRGYCVMRGYWNDEKKTKECITPEGWFRTGDIASLDEYGYCQILGRMNDMIIRGGENIYPAEIEEFLHTHPKVEEIQVIGVNDEKMGEEICACIRIKEGTECTAQEIKDYCKGQISHFKIPRYIIFVKDMPMTVTGKIQKYKLRKKIEEDLGLEK
uniref:Medium-chain acyl-CoA ligase ACSF2, mitochondrial n=1 Tax=Callorhinchus milii TaxID=7868 RepID=A0A4W3GRJ9_CALMI